jgi:uncharacterized protein
MNTNNLIDKTILFVKATLAQAEGGHDWFHIERVYKNAVLIAASENCDLEIVQLGALLHDIADSKFHDGDETIGPRTARTFLESEKVAPATIDHVIAIIENISFKGGKVERQFSSIELILYKMPIDWMPLEPLALPEHSIMADSRTEHCTILKLSRI